LGEIRVSDFPEQHGGFAQHKKTSVVEACWQRNRIGGAAITVVQFGDPKVCAQHVLASTAQIDPQSCCVTDGWNQVGESLKVESMRSVGSDTQIGDWSSQDSVETLSAQCVNRFELLGTHATEMTVTARPIVERFDVVGHIGDRQLPVLVDLFLDPLFLQAAEE
jgi:hypothetical protein